MGTKPDGNILTWLHLLKTGHAIPDPDHLASEHMCFGFLDLLLGTEAHGPKQP